MTAPQGKPPLKLGEFITLMAAMISFVAMSTDAMLPALPEIGADLGVAGSNDAQLIVPLLVLGMAIGQPVFGPLSDSYGRKPAIAGGMLLFLIGCAMSILAEDLTIMLAGRLLQGIGLAGPRTVAVALIRDQYEGRAMARIMSFIMAVFILVPAMAPAMGEGILLFAHWRWIFVMFAVAGALVLTWFLIRQPETLVPEKRAPFTLRRIAVTVVEIVRIRATLGYTIAIGFVFGSFLSYLSSAQPIFDLQYGQGDWFALYFGLLSLAIGAASIVNARLVMRLGMRTLTRAAAGGLTALSCIFLVTTAFMQGDPPFWAFLIFLMLAFFCFGWLFGNLNALAMGPLGHVAGTGAALVGSLATIISVPLAIAIGQAFDGTILPLIAGFAVFSGATLLFSIWAGR
ncbi:MAG: multidrug effflux MFS transporter [Pseudomonadota bacterium]